VIRADGRPRTWLHRDKGLLLFRFTQMQMIIMACEENGQHINPAVLPVEKNSSSGRGPTMI